MDGERKRIFRFHGLTKEEEEILNKPLQGSTIPILRHGRSSERIATRRIKKASEKAKADYPDDCVDCFADQVARILTERGMIFNSEVHQTP